MTIVIHNHAATSAMVTSGTARRADAIALRRRHRPVYAVIDATSFGLQLATGLVLKLAGLRLTLVALPIILGALLPLFLLAPRAGIMIAKVGGENADYDHAGQQQGGAPFRDAVGTSRNSDSVAGRAIA